MKAASETPHETNAATEDPDGSDQLLPFVSTQVASATPFLGGVVVGELVGILHDGATPLVVFPGRSGSAAVRGRTVVDLHGVHVGCSVVLMFEGDDQSRPIVMGVIRGESGWPLDALPGQVEVDAGGGRLVVAAKDKLVLRCGKARITLTKAGKVLIEGAYVSSRATSVNRVKGGSVQLN